ncbi:hypothetical protein [Streptomyces sp. NBC_00620]|uniref:hypothetical protein n=1 Tax=Streptomyces sp. NBC_00620 TaxID=2903666 RepID=UPI002254A45B|nr:hypothetical protein [Streptomyces sp. NBC_00620]MCX4972393.1 hypothetical protein [Streptomyces sp. NBC_00620]
MRSARRLLTGLAATAAFGALLAGPSYAAAAPAAQTAPANDAVSWSCSSITRQYMTFEDGTPVHAEPAGSSKTIAWLSTTATGPTDRPPQHVRDRHDAMPAHLRTHRADRAGDGPGRATG